MEAVYEVDGVVTGFGLWCWGRIKWGSALYPRDQAFLELVQQEVEYQVRSSLTNPNPMPCLASWYIR